MTIRNRGFRTLVLGLLVAVSLALAPSAFARSHLSIGINLPGLSLGYHDGHHSHGYVSVGGYYGGGYYGSGYYAPSYYDGYYAAPAPVYYDSYYYAPTYRVQYRSRPVYHGGHDSRYYRSGHDRGHSHGGYSHGGYGHRGPSDPRYRH